MGLLFLLAAFVLAIGFDFKSYTRNEKLKNKKQAILPP